jgi:pimeloyl-ACP methyl ester carboxylesterase
VRDVETVMDALKLRKAALFGDSAGGATAIAYTVRHPERVSRLVLCGSFVRLARSPQAVQRWQALITLVRSDWGTDNPAYRQMWASLFMPVRLRLISVGSARMSESR